MKKECIGLSVGVLFILFMVQPLLAMNYVDDPSYSQIDGLAYSDSTVDCIDFHNSEACELFRAKAAYSPRDGVFFTDCSMDCHDFIDSESCFSYRQTYPCGTALTDHAVASIR